MLSGLALGVPEPPELAGGEAGESSGGGGRAKNGPEEGLPEPLVTPWEPSPALPPVPLTV